MSKIATFLTLLVTVLVGSLPAAPAQAQALRTFVSAAGSDSNNCTDVSTPCRHFFQAYAATSPGGEIDVLDPANYGGLVINQAISIEGQGWATMSAGAGTAAITITAGPSDKINIRGVVLDGFGIANNIGIQFNTGGSLNVQDSEIRNFGNDGISFDPSATAVLLVSNTLVSDNGSSGIFISGGGSGGLAGTLDHVTLEHNATDGLHVQNFNATQSDNFTISDSVSAHNGTDGVNVIAGSGSITQVMVQNSTIANNGTGLAASGAGAPVLRVTRSTITGNGSGWSISTNGVVASYVDNIIDGNGNNNSTPAGTPPTYH